MLLRLLKLEWTDEGLQVALVLPFEQPKPGLRKALEPRTIATTGEPIADVIPLRRTA